MRRVRDESFSLEAPGVYILNVSVEGVLSSTFPVKWESVSVQSCDCRTVVGVRMWCVLYLPGRGCGA